jgi:hypothetical protein
MSCQNVGRKFHYVLSRQNRIFKESSCARSDKTRSLGLVTFSRKYCGVLPKRRSLNCYSELWCLNEHLPDWQDPDKLVGRQIISCRAKSIRCLCASDQRVHLIHPLIFKLFWNSKWIAEEQKFMKEFPWISLLSQSRSCWRKLPKCGSQVPLLWINRRMKTTNVRKTDCPPLSKG